MPIDFSRLRMQQIFGPQGVSSSMPMQPTMPTGGDMEDYDAASRLRQIYNPQMDMQNKFSSTIDAMPRREDYKLGKVQQIGAALANLGSGGPAAMWGGNPVGFRSNIPGGMAVQRELQDRPFNTATGDWERKLRPLGQAADNERLSNTNERILANDIVRGEQNDRRLSLTEKKNDQANKIAADKLEIQEKRAKAYVEAQEFKRMHPKLQSVIDDKTGELMFIDPSEPDKIIKTGIDQLSPTEKLNLEVKNAKELISARGAEDRNTKGTAPAINPNVSKPRPASASQEMTGTINRIIQAVNADPKLADYFELGTNGKPTGQLKKPGWFDNAELRQKALSIANGSAASNTNTSMVKMKDKNGKEWDVKPENVAAFKAANGIK